MPAAPSQREVVDDNRRAAAGLWLVRAAIAGFPPGGRPRGVGRLWLRDRDMDLADACIVRMTELTRNCRVITVDRTDFSVYRRNGRDLIPIVSPPAA